MINYITSQNMSILLEKRIIIKVKKHKSNLLTIDMNIKNTNTELLINESTKSIPLISIPLEKNIENTTKKRRNSN